MHLALEIDDSKQAVADKSDVSLTRTERLMTKGFKAVAQRMVNAERTMIETLMNIANLSETEARKAFVTLAKVKGKRCSQAAARSRTLILT